MIINITVRCALRGIENFKFTHTYNSQVQPLIRLVAFPSCPPSLSLLSGSKTVCSGKPAYARCRPTAGCGDLIVARTTAVTRPAVYTRLHMYVCRRCDLRDNVNSLVKGPAERNCRQAGRGGTERKREKEYAKRWKANEKRKRRERNTFM